MTTERMAAGKRPTLADVAALAQVSKMVASRAINSTGSVSPAASARVHAAVEMLGYVVHQGARSLSTNRTGAVAFLAPLQNARFFGDPNVAQILSGINQGVRAADLQLVTLIVEDEHDAHRAAAYVRGRYVDGVMVLSPELVSDLVRDLASAGTALSANGFVDGAPDLDAIVLPTRQRAADMANLLRGEGVERITVLAGPLENPSTEEFLLGIEQTIGRLEPSQVAHGNHSHEAGTAGMRRLLNETPDLDGVIVASDVMAVAAVGVLAEQGRPVPGAVKVTGWDDSVRAVPGVPGLTTLHIPYQDIGRRMAEMLVEQLGGSGSGRRESVDTRIVRRESA